MLLHRYKARFGHASEGVGAKRAVLVAWFIFGLFIAFIPLGRTYGLFFPSIFLWFFELLVIFLAQEHKFFRRSISWMLFLFGTVFMILHYTEEIWEHVIQKQLHVHSSNYKFQLLILSIWHFVAYVIALITTYFNKR